MKKTSKLIILILALCTMAFSTYGVAAAGGDLWTVETDYTSENKAKEIFAYENPFDYLTVKKNGEEVDYEDYKNRMTVTVYKSDDSELNGNYYEFNQDKGTILYRYLSDAETNGNYKVKAEFDFDEDGNVDKTKEIYVSVTKYAPEGTLSYDTDAAKIAAARAAAKDGSISGTYTIPKDAMNAIVKSEVYDKSDLHVAVYVIKPKGSVPTTATSTKDDGTYPQITVSDPGTYYYWILYGDKVYDEDHRYIMTTEGLKRKPDGWYKGNNLVVPIFSFTYNKDAKEFSIKASGVGEEGVVNRVYSSITFNIENGSLIKDGLVLQYSKDSTDGSNGEWNAATEDDAEFDASSFTVSSISFKPKKTGYYRVACLAQSTVGDDWKSEYATVRVQKEYVEVELVDTRLRDFFTNNWKSLIFFGLAILSLAGILVVALYKPKNGKSKKAVVKEDAEEKAAEEATEAEVAEEPAEENAEAVEEPAEENAEAEAVEEPAQAEEKAEEEPTETADGEDKE